MSTTRLWYPNRRPALAEEDPLVAGGPALLDDVSHVVGRQELALLDVDRLAGPRRGGDEVGLPRQRNAGICSTSRTAAAGSACSGSCMSESSGSPVFAFTSRQISSPLQARVRGTSRSRNGWPCRRTT